MGGSDGPWIGAGSIYPTGGRRVRSFEAVDADGNLYEVDDYEMIIASRLIRADGMNRRSQQRTYWKLADGSTRVVRHAGEPKTFKILDRDLVIWQVP